MVSHITTLSDPQLPCQMDTMTRDNFSASIRGADTIHVPQLSSARGLQHGSASNASLLIQRLFPPGEGAFERETGPGPSVQASDLRDSRVASAQSTQSRASRPITAGPSRPPGDVCLTRMITCLPYIKVRHLRSYPDSLKPLSPCS